MKANKGAIRSALLTAFFVFATIRVIFGQSWDDRFDTLGIDGGAVLAIAVNGTDLYIGGSFTMAGQVSANNIAKWDGSSWSALGSGTNDNVLALAVSGNDLYVGGSFTTAGGVSANKIAKWDGSNWSALGDGIGGDDVKAIAVNSNDVYVGGFFSSAGGVSANNVAKWDGSNWSTLGSGVTNGVNAPVFTIAINNDDVYLGGSFTTAGGENANKIVCWNSSTSTWSQLSSGVSLGDINSIIVNQNNVYAGGLFTSAGGVSAKKVAKWDGSDWTALAEGLSGGDVNDMVFIGNDLYVAGSFTTADNISANRVAKWNGSAWSALGSGIEGGPVFALGAVFLDLYSGGSFSTAGGNVSNKFALWNNGTVPVELVSFTAQAEGSKVNLNWTTATEQNNFGFEVERQIENSMDSEWSKIGFLQGHGTTTRPQNYSYTDDIEELRSATDLIVNYRLKQIDLDGTFEYHSSIEVVIELIPENLTLKQNYPNPFNPETTIEFIVPSDVLITLKIYNILGQQIATLVNDNLEKGILYKASFDGSQLPSGTYIYILSAGSFTERKTMLLLK